MIPSVIVHLLAAVPPPLLVAGGICAVLLVAGLSAGGAYVLAGRRWPG